jgi:ketosteroid isomerase-like protein
VIGAIRSSLDTERHLEDEEGHNVAFGHTWGRVCATGRECGVPETHLWTVKEGKVARFEAYRGVYRYPDERYPDEAWGARALGCPGPSPASSSSVFL